MRHSDTGVEDDAPRDAAALTGKARDVARSLSVLAGVLALSAGPVIAQGAVTGMPGMDRGPLGASGWRMPPMFPAWLGKYFLFWFPWKILPAPATS